MMTLLPNLQDVFRIEKIGNLWYYDMATTSQESLKRKVRSFLQYLC